MPGRAHKKEYAEREMQTQIAVEGVRNGTYMSVDHAAKALGVSRTTLRMRLSGRQTRKEARESQQLLSTQEEKALADWIANAASSGNPVTHAYIKEVVEGIRKSRSQITDEYLRPIGSSWHKAFFRRHPQLQTKLSRAIEMARIKDVTREQITNFNRDFRRIIHDKHIKQENIYNCDETGTISG
jgi:hypothetical protein